MRTLDTHSWGEKSKQGAHCSQQQQTNKLKHVWKAVKNIWVLVSSVHIVILKKQTVIKNKNGLFTVRMVDPFSQLDHK